MTRFVSLLMAWLLVASSWASPAVAQNIGDFDKVTRISAFRNYIRNPSAQFNMLGIVTSNATATRSTTTPVGEGGSEWNVTVTSANGYIDFTQTGATTANLGGASCEASIRARGFQATSLFQVHDIGGLLYSVAIGALTTAQYVTINFPCPADPSNLKTRITDTATLAGTNEVAEGYLGRSRNIGDAGNFTAWTAYTPTLTNFGTVSGSEFFWRRVGDSIDVQGRFLSGTPVAAAAGFALPSGLTLGTFTNTQAVGRWMTNSVAGTAVKGGPIIANTTSGIGWSGDDYTTTQSPFTFRNASAFATASEAISVYFRVPVANWLTASSAISPAGGVKTRVRYTTAAGQSIASGAVTIVDYGTLVDRQGCGTVTTGASWRFTPCEPGWYQVNAKVIFASTAWTAGDGILFYLYKTGAAVDIKRWAASATFTNYAPSQEMSTAIYLTLSDYLDLRVEQSNAGSKSLLNSAAYNTLSIAQLDGPPGSYFVQSPVKAAGTATAPIAGDIDETVTSAPANFSQAAPTLNTAYNIGTLAIPSAGSWLVTFSSAQNLNPTGAAQFAEINLTTSGGTQVYAIPCVLSPGQASGDAFGTCRAETLIRTTGAVTVTAATKHSNFKTGSPGTPTSIGSYANQFVGTRKFDR